ncbi:MAG: NADP-dependent malic enzyme [Bacteroidetes bacterium CG2_30_33_31]|nr:MAG: NADP-dependent malic enzyme [Bacteroidetes bacterium CG2_30_33_31]
MDNLLKKRALEYHSKGKPGKVEVIPTKPYSTQRDLSLAYTPGVAYPCLEIEKNPDDIYKYTNKGNLVAVISNGTAVLGLGNIGAAAGKPVMEGKGLLFKIFSDIDVFDIEVSTRDIDTFVETVIQIAPTFGGINLEDIKAPECFEIERRVKEALDIPVMHDDQHGTAIISAAGLVSAMEITGKNLSKVKLVVSGAGAAASACTRLYISLGVKPENVLMCDSKGVLTTKRTDLNDSKKEFARNTNKTNLADALVGADIFLGLSAKGAMTKEMLASMAPNPIVFAMANPDPEISYEDAMATRDDLIFATGRSDFPNQINNVLGFPYIFRGALDVSSSAINEEMKKAAVYALANLAKQPVPDVVKKAYNKTEMSFGRFYIVPTPLDPRLIEFVAPAVAKAAMDSGVARKPITDWDEYKSKLRQRMGIDHSIMRSMYTKAKANPKKVVFADANDIHVLQAAIQVKQEGFAFPILLGEEKTIKALAKKSNIDIKGIQIIDNTDVDYEGKRMEFAQILYNKRQRRGISLKEAQRSMFNRNYFGVAMVETGMADAMISGTKTNYADVMRPALQIINKVDNIGKIAGMYILNTKKGPFFFADTTVNTNPTSEDLVDIALLTSEAVKEFGVDPVMAMLSYSNYGSSDTGSPINAAKAVSILHQKYPEIMIDGEMQANFALNTEMRTERYPFSKLGNRNVNTLIFPNLDSGNIAYKMMQEIGHAEAIGPIVMGLKKSIHVLQLSSTVREIMDMVAIAVVDAQTGSL